MHHQHDRHGAQHADHGVQFYESESFLAEQVASFIAGGLDLGACAVIIATEAHRAAITERLRARTADLDRLIDTGRLVLLDAAATLGRFMVDGVPSPDLFKRTVGEVVASLSRASGGKGVRAYGEMVDLLWREGRRSAAILLEELWNDLRTAHEFQLLCAYEMASFRQGGGLYDVCNTHSHVLAPEHRPASPAAPAAPSADVHALIAEIARRTETELALRGALRELRRSEAQARGAQEDLADFIEHAAIAIHRVDMDGIIQYVNRAELQMLGYTAEELVGRHIAELHVDPPVIEDILARLMRGETLRDHDARLRAKDGSIRLVQITSNVQTRDGERRTTRCFTRDVTALKRAEAEHARLLGEAQAARVQAEQANRTKDQFLAVLGHELRNPLSPILSAVQLMRLRGDERSAREQNIIERQVEHLIHMVDDLLDIARITQDKVELDQRPLEIAALVAKAVEITAPACEERGHAVQVCMPDEALWVEGDEPRLCQVLTNLLTNAAKYTQRGGRIDVRVSRDAADVCISVRDNGMGIAPDVLPRIFDSFVQGHRVMERGIGGLGIGLALVRNLVAMHGGSVRAASDGPGRGSELVVRLPVIELRAVKVPPDAAATSRRRAAVTPKKVLVVDDNEDAGMLLSEMLRSVGHEVMVAMDAERALEIVEGFTPDAAILDIGLPTMSGYELAAVLRQRLGPALWLMAVTGYGQERDRVRALQSGFDSHFLKPVSVQTVIAALELTKLAP